MDAPRRNALALAALSFVSACNLVLGNLQDRPADGGSDVATGTSSRSGSSRGADSGNSSSSSSGSGSSGGTSTRSGSGSSDGTSSSSGPDGAAACMAGTQRCSDASRVETCSTSGQWGDVWPCASGTCANGACAEGVTTVPPSCQTAGAGRTTCGSMAEDCCTSPEVTGGTYYRTYTSSGTVVSGVGDPATVSGFRLDKYLVTVGRFRELVAAWNGGAGYLPSMGFGKHAHLNGGKGLLNSGDVGTYEAGWDATAWNGPPDLDPTDANLTSCPDSTWTSVAAGQENLPINCVNWWEAYAFCIWDGGFLPSEAEWEYAAAGGSLQREYPWGATTPGTACPGAGCEYAIYNCDYPNGTGSCTGVANIAPVGTATLGAGLWGQLDMAGDVVEWNLDWYEPSYGNPCADCSYLAPETERAFRGGHFGVGVAGLSPPDRAGSAPTGRDSTWGFRCARTP